MPKKTSPEQLVPSSIEGRRRILIIEDHLSSAEMMSTILKMVGYEPIIAYNGPSALGKAALEKPDLILLDIMLPEMNGIEVCKKLKNSPNTSDVPIIIVSAKVAEESIKAGMEAGAVDYIKKPFGPNELVKAIKKHV